MVPTSSVFIWAASESAIRNPQSAMSMRRLRVRRAVRHREDHVQRHQRLQRMRAGVDERADMLAHEPAFPDADQLLRSLPLRAAQLVLDGHAVQVLDDAVAEFCTVAHIEQQAVETVRFRGRMLVELVAAVLELEA